MVTHLHASLISSSVSPRSFPTASLNVLTHLPICSNELTKYQWQTERNNSYYFSPANQQKAGTKIYSLTQCSLTVNGCDWHILAGNDVRINSHCLTRRLHSSRMSTARLPTVSRCWRGYPTTPRIAYPPGRDMGPEIPYPPPV